ncbi:MAG TPA: trypsin-like peptidase domain-containing protein [Candidatus Acidoferrales bacterium]|jgi:DNA-binding response OmpR family regulator/S1-C subfamily serine protease|nr:trypsin-like peptidase domain-containing protein [Candidatus Acidoferrales bacterium]
MTKAREKIVVVEADAVSRGLLLAAIESAGYEVLGFATAREGLDAARQPGTDLLVLDAALSDADAFSVHEMVATIRGSAMTESVRVILLTRAGAGERAAGLDLGADDAISRPWEAAELLARIRAQLRVLRADQQLVAKMRLAEEGQQIAHTAFDALAVTEKMSSDAVSLNRRLKMGLAGVFAIAVVMAGTYFLFAHSAQKNMKFNTTTIARLERGFVHQQDLMAEARKLRGEQGVAGAAPAGKDELQKQVTDLKTKMAGASSDEGAELRKELDDTNARLKRIEQEGDSAQNLIRADVDSVCLLHVAVAFRNQQSGQRLRYAGLNQQGEPLQDSDGNPVLTLEGNGPEVRIDVFGTGFPAGPEGRIVTNRHVAQPWWDNDELSDLTSQGFTAEISSIRAYFPGDPRAFNTEIEEISKNADLATMRIKMQDLKRPILTIDSGKGAAVTGDPVVLMGYATGLAAILARTDEDTAQQIVSHSGSDVSEVLNELARRNLIHPLITQGHIGDILPDKIVFDAQTTSGGSGGPLFNKDGKVIGVTFAVLKGFGGSNFGIPIRFSEPLLASAPTHASN